MSPISRREAKSLYARLVKQGEQLADVEQAKFVILRDPREGYTLAALKDVDLCNTAERAARPIVRWIRPEKESPKEPQNKTPKQKQERGNETKSSQAERANAGHG